MKQLNVGLIGAGYWGKKYLRVIKEHPSVNLSFIADTDSSLRSTIENRTGAKFYNDFVEALSEAECDAVIVTTPANTHKQVVLECIRNGKNVLVEKPFTLNLKDAEDILLRSRASGIALFPGHIYSYNGGIKKAAEIVQSGSIGTIRYIDCVRDGLGPIRDDVNVIWDLIPHDLTILNIVGLSHPEKVSCIASSFLRRDIYDLATCALRYGSNRVAHIQASWLHPSKVRQITIVGQDKMIIFDDTNQDAPLKVYDKKVDLVTTDNYGQFKSQIRAGDVIMPFVSTEEPLLQMFNAFVDFCHGKREQELKVEQARALETVRVLEALEASARQEGRFIHLDWPESA